MQIAYASQILNNVSNNEECQQKMNMSHIF